VTEWKGTTLRLEQAPDVNKELPGEHPGGTGMVLHLPEARLRVAPGTAVGLASWYRKFLGANVVETTGRCEVEFGCSVGWSQRLVFEEDPSVEIPQEDDLGPETEKYHICVYVDSNQSFKQCFTRARDAQLIFVNERFEGGPVEFASATTWAEAHDCGQFRVRDIRDPDSAVLLLRLEHEIRSPSHKCFPLGRALQRASRL